MKFLSLALFIFSLAHCAQDLVDSRMLLPPQSISNPKIILLSPQFVSDGIARDYKLDQKRIAEAYRVAQKTLTQKWKHRYNANVAFKETQFEAVRILDEDYFFRRLQLYNYVRNKDAVEVGRFLYNRKAIASYVKSYDLIIIPVLRVKSYKGDFYGRASRFGGSYGYCPDQYWEVVTLFYIAFNSRNQIIYSELHDQKLMLTEYNANRNLQLHKLNTDDGIFVTKCIVIKDPTIDYHSLFRKIDIALPIR